MKYKLLLILSGMSVSADLVAIAAPHLRRNQPNIIYILADDLGFSELGCYGQTLIETPNINALAKDGMIFTNHYAGQAVSAPSRCSLFTGLHSGHAYIRGNDEMEERGDVWNHRAMLADSTLEGQRPLPVGTIMIPHKLKEGGYVTACIGKWGLGYPGSVSTPIKMGFDFFYGYNCQRQAHTYYPPFLYRNEQREYLNNQFLSPNTKLDRNEDVDNALNYERFAQQDYAPDVMFRELVQFVNQYQSQPFAVFWTTPVPHVPLQAPAKWVDYYREKFGSESPYLGNQGYFPCRYPRATYAAMVSYLDEQVGGLVKLLKSLGIYEQTLIIFTSDNGPSYNGGSDSPYFGSARPHRSEKGWGKGSLHEGGIHVPMIACWPNKIEPGTKSDLLSACWDIMPTFCDLLDVDAPPTDGISMLPTFLGKKRRQKHHDYLYWEFPDSGGQKAVRMGDWKAFVGQLHRGNRQIELYNISEDPLERHDVAASHPDIIKKVLQIFKESHQCPMVKNFEIPVW